MGKERYVKVKSPLFEDGYWEGLALRSSIRKDVLKLDDFAYEQACAFQLDLGFDEQPWTLENLRELIHKYTRIPARRIVFAERGRDLEADFEFDGGETLARNYKLTMRICRDAVGRCGVPASPDARPLDALPDVAVVELDGHLVSLDRYHLARVELAVRPRRPDTHARRGDRAELLRARAAEDDARLQSSS